MGFTVTARSADHSPVGKPIQFRAEAIAQAEAAGYAIQQMKLPGIAYVEVADEAQGGHVVSLFRIAA